ncbi:hypothetical protein ACA910_013601 [Epithemia clementina (nom. ined.)]
MPPPSSLQQSATGSKSAKFVGTNGLTNPFDPMIQPFASPNESEHALQQTLAENLNQRLQATMGDLQERHRTGRNEVDHPDRAPTGPAYRQQQQQQQQQQQVQAQQQQQHKAQQQQARIMDDNDIDDDDDDEDFLNDPALDELRERRLQELKQAHDLKLQQLALGHGQYRTIRQDEFLTECHCQSSPDKDNHDKSSSSSKSSSLCITKFVVVHFAHDEFELCRLMDHHLQQLATQYLECKFVRLVAPKAPFFVQKFQVRTLPTLLVFDTTTGQLVKRLVGFEGLVDSNPKHNNNNNPNATNQPSSSSACEDFETWRLAQWLATETGAIQFKGPKTARMSAR